MKLGILARAEDRGLGIQSWEAVRHLDPERVMVIDVQNPEGFPMHLDRYPGATVAALQSGLWLNETLLREWLSGLDVVLSFESLYDWRVATWAREMGVATVVQLNPEFFQHDQQHLDLPAPDVWWNPTTWRMDKLPAGTRHVPVPVAWDRFLEPSGVGAPTGATSERLRALHVVGRPALADRNGTELLAKAMRRTQHVDMTWRSQRPTDHHTADLQGEVADYWRLYDDHDVLVLPRRYGGLCLPAQEAMGAGLAVVMPSCSPNTEMWPIVPVQWRYRGELPVPAGSLPLVETDARDLAAVLDQLATDDGALAAAKEASAAWATEHCWPALRPLYDQELARAADGAGRSLRA